MKPKKPKTVKPITAKSTTKPKAIKETKVKKTYTPIEAINEFYALKAKYESA